MKPSRTTSAASPFGVLSTSAWVLLLAAALARMMLTEYVREPFLSSASRVGGPEYGIALDLLCCVPALLVLFRWTLDRSFALRWSWCFAPLLALGAWIALSTCWAADRFAAAVDASHLVAAVAMLWAAAQLITDWLRLRLLAAILLGLLLALIGQGVIYRYMDLPAMQRDWNQYFCPQHPQIVQDIPGKCPICGKPLVRRGDWELAQRGWEPHSFMAQQMEKNLASGSTQGFYGSANTFAAAAVLLMILAMGWIAQHLSEGRAREGPMLLPVLGLLGGIWLLVYTASRTASATAVLAVMLLAAVWQGRAWLAQHAARAFGFGLATIAVVAAAVVGYGYAHGGLVHSSLTFRWWYWVGAARMFADHWFHGVGWSNFGLYYLQYRLPIASEEVKDPHNFLIRFFVECGLVGGGLAVAWLVGMWWRMTRGVPQTSSGTAPPRALGPLLAVTGLATGLAIVFGIDWTLDASYVVGELLKRSLFACLLLGSSVALAVRPIGAQEADDRPAPWLLYAMVIALGMLMLHGMVDFALSESGPLCLMGVLAGAVVGIRSGPGIVAKRRGLAAPALLTAAATVLWLAVAIRFWAPTLRAEQAAQAADQKIQAGAYDDAIPLLETAARYQPLNADYLFRAARCAQPAPTMPATDALAAAERTDALIAAAIAADPMNGDYPHLRAQADLLAHRTNPPANRIRTDWQTVLKLDPCNVWARLQYADALAQLGDKAEAGRQYSLALSYDDKLDPHNNKRLTKREVNATRKTIDSLSH